MMRSIFILILSLSLGICSAQNKKKNPAKQPTQVEKIIKLFQQKNKSNIAKSVAYPLQREYPLAPVKTEKEMISRFDQIFDKVLIDKIAKSKASQWSKIGWRGWMLEDGIVWINEDGKISAVNYNSAYEIKQRKSLIAVEKSKVHPSLKNFESPVMRFKTKNHLVRIDKLANGNYRYASWKANAKESDKPDLIINNGSLNFDGTGGNHNYNFANNNYNYTIFRNIIGENDVPEVSLVITKDFKDVVEEEGKLITK